MSSANESASERLKAAADRIEWDGKPTRIVLLDHALREVAALEAERNAMTAAYNAASKDLDRFLDQARSLGLQYTADPKGFYKNAKAELLEAQIADLQNRLDQYAALEEPENAALIAELRECYGEMCKFCETGPDVWPVARDWNGDWFHRNITSGAANGCFASRARERAYQRQQAAKVGE